MMHTVVTNLNEYLESCWAKSFAFGQFDCCLFVADWIKYVRGFDPAPERGTYTTLKQGLNIIKNDFKHTFEQRLNVKPTSVGFAQRGDVALCEHENELVGGIVGLGCVYCVSDEGVTTLPLNSLRYVYALEDIHE
ncbi:MULTISPECIES: DUF6950 family protein [Pseudoalteromonas]|uniref:DUF6950 domain-containing protein n=1 Tax=Pseudoalteromonas amylolytica TaxID=1859457 RepID=A0A1S1N149_9GAMM|nr:MULTISPECIES: hypothetical protein [Pseudoalteromonas]OHU85534.1 hypothetical protein BFC16_19490 [Pseudoalteromonas sp. JW3]OHU91768.1 hypothetical protein BET10_08185 [Pseudoalteromonas amylolytica]